MGVELVSNLLNCAMYYTELRSDIDFDKQPLLTESEIADSPSFLKN